MAMNEDKDMMQLKTAVILFLLIISISILIEAAFLIYAYLNADEIRCNLIFCEFVTKNSNIIEHTTIEQTSECYSNGVKINCTDMNDIIDDYVAQK